MNSGPFPEMSNKLSQAVAKLAHEYADSHRVSYAMALKEVAAAYSELVEQAREEVLRRKYEYKTLDLPGKPVMTIYLSEQLSKMAKTRASRKGISFREALCEIGREDPELCHAVRSQVLGKI